MSNDDRHISVRKHVLIVDSSAAYQDKIRRILSGGKIACHKALSVKAALGMLSKRTYDVVLVETDLPDKDGYELVKLIAEKSPSTQVVPLTSSGDFRKVSRCMTAGAFNYLRKPFQPEQLEFLVETALDAQPAPSENLFLIEKVPPAAMMDRLIGKSRAMKKIYKQIRLSSATDIHVLLMGESGTGKELIARSIHEHSARSQERFIAVNTGAVEPNLISSELFGHVKGAFTGARSTRKGMFEVAHRGTLFLDELSTMDEQIQISLLRVLDDRIITKVGGSKAIKVDVRIIAATNSNIEDEVKHGRFREDLYHRLNVFTINAPSLRERKSDIKMLADFFISHSAQKFDRAVDGITNDALNLLRAYDWPGNVRELKNTIQRAVLLCSGNKITPDVLPDRLKTRSAIGGKMTVNVGKTLAHAEREYIVATLTCLRGNKKETARVLGISRKSLYNKIKRYNI